MDAICSATIIDPDPEPYKEHPGVHHPIWGVVRDV